jgi:putative peptidoglycan lipid II flippase
MLPALLGVSVAQISLLINTQIASHLAPGSVSWLTYADRLMEFPTAMLGVALGVVLMPQLAAARAGRRGALFGHARLGPAPGGAAGGAVFGGAADLCQPLVATLFHYGAFSDATSPDHHGADGLRRGLLGWWPSRCWRRATTPARTCARRCASPSWCW